VSARRLSGMDAARSDTLAAIVRVASGSKNCRQRISPRTYVRHRPGQEPLRRRDQLADLVPPESVTLHGTVGGLLGFGPGTGRIALSRDGSSNAAYLSYDAGDRGKRSPLIGGRMLDGAARLVIGRFSRRSPATWMEASRKVSAGSEVLSGRRRMSLRASTIVAR